MQDSYVFLLLDGVPDSLGGYHMRASIFTVVLQTHQARIADLFQLVVQHELALEDIELLLHIGDTSTFIPRFMIIYSS